MTISLRVVFSIGACLFASGSHSTPHATVYDWFSDQLLQHKSHLAVASTTDSRWFNENPVESIVAMGTIGKGTEPPWLGQEHVPLLRRLFEQNVDDAVLEWTPANQRVRLLDGNYRARPRQGDEIDSMCFAAEAMVPIGVATDPHGDRSFRPYYSFSKAAFSEDGQFAMMKVAYACAPMSGAHEGIIILRRHGEAWEMTGGARFWVS